MDLHNCVLCPRKCGADRYKSAGFCGCEANVRAAKAFLHMWEEPCLSGENGAGTVFFSGCCLKCCYCQNYKISHENIGMEITVKRLAEIFLELQEKGAHNIDLVSPTPYVPQIIEALELCRDRLKIPIIYNTGGYERVETLKLLEGYVDVYLPDFKYFDDGLAEKYSAAQNYFETVTAALKEMYRQVGACQIESGILRRGMIIRHLALPSHRRDSVKVLEWIAENFPKGGVLVSLMSQYTPCYGSCQYKEISRRISTFEYNFVLERARELGLEGFMQERSSAKEEYTPEFDFEGVL
ncbi:MAG: radical SAM protein [Ruminococcus sp.]|nr:radical SAM protein [Ruminococcus sp.]MCM1380482.1 radical SAM protein [Muribaculaceae bacterium]MCM1478146.1 radical SAM protein [Muribaculaceae bacterium]